MSRKSESHLAVPQAFGIPLPAVEFLDLYCDSGWRPEDYLPVQRWSGCQVSQRVSLVWASGAAAAPGVHGHHSHPVDQASWFPVFPRKLPRLPEAVPVHGGSDPGRHQMMPEAGVIRMRAAHQGLWNGGDPGFPLPVGSSPEISWRASATEQKGPHLEAQEAAGLPGVFIGILEWRPVWGTSWSLRKVKDCTELRSSVRLSLENLSRNGAPYLAWRQSLLDSSVLAGHRAGQASGFALK